MNKRYGHSGTLFQGQCKGKHVDSREYCLRLVRYVHRNPIAFGCGEPPERLDVLRLSRMGWHKNKLLADFELRDAFFKAPSQYERYVEDYTEDKEVSVDLRTYVA